MKNIIVTATDEDTPRVLERLANAPELTVQVGESLHDFIARVERTDFRTKDDTGASVHALYIWNKVRQFAGLPRLEVKDLPAYCTTHGCYHVLRAEYGCAMPSKGADTTGWVSRTSTAREETK